MNLASILSPHAVFVQLAEGSKKQALKKMAAEAELLTGLVASQVFSVLMEREHAGCTGVGGGVAIPHGRYENLDKIHALFATFKKPVEFGAADGVPVDMICVLLSPLSENTGHLKAMATISRLLRDKRLCQNLRIAPDAPHLYDALIHHG